MGSTLWPPSKFSLRTDAKFCAAEKFTQPHPRDIQLIIPNAVAAQRSSSSSATIMQEMNRTTDGREQTRTAIRLSQNSTDSSESFTPVQNSPSKRNTGPPKKRPLQDLRKRSLINIIFTLIKETFHIHNSVLVF